MMVLVKGQHCVGVTWSMFSVGVEVEKKRSGFLYGHVC